MTQDIKMPSTSTILSAVASAAATSMLIRSLAKDYLPYEFQNYIFSKIHYLLHTLSSEITIIIEEYDGLTKNQLFESTELYLGKKISPSTRRFRATIPDKQSKLLFSMDRNQEIVDVFNGVKLTWRRVSTETQGRYVARHGRGDPYNPVMISEIRYFELSFHKKHKDMVVATYFPHLRSESLRVQEEIKTLKLHTLRYSRRYMGDGDPWQAVNLDHPATFDTLGMDIELKEAIMDDLRMFVKRKEFYRKVGKAWKRGYLLFGPPGTGKSSLIGAMANYLNFDIYDLELTSIPSNSDLRKLLISTGNKSILVVEDIDCSIDLDKRKEARATNPWSTGEEVTLSGLLNFIDGLWSSCGDERLIVFTTNHKDRLDPALLRPGRMDMHIHMSYCTPCGFKMLASNYLGLTQHSLFEEVEPLIQMVKVTPAEVAEQLMKSEDPEAALRGLVDFLEEKKASEKFVAEAEATELEAKAENEPQEIECRE